MRAPEKKPLVIDITCIGNIIPNVNKDKLLLTQICVMKLDLKASPTNRSAPAMQAGQQNVIIFYLLSNTGLVFSAIITSTFVRIEIEMLITAVVAKAIFST